MSNDPNADDPFGTLALENDEIDPAEIPYGLVTPGVCDPEELRVIEGCYRNGPKGSGCVAFVISEDADGVDTGIERFDDVVPNYGMAKPETEAAKWAQRMGWPAGMEPSISEVEEFQVWAAAEVAAETYYALKEHRAARAAAAAAPPKPEAPPDQPEEPDPVAPQPRRRGLTA